MAASHFRQDHMKTIGLLSDTHGYLDPEIWKYFDGCDEIWHAGDFGNVRISEALSSRKPLRGVYGNIDGAQLRLLHPQVLVFSVEGVKVMMVHIGGKPGRYAAGIEKTIREEHPGLFICGHSHITKAMNDPVNKLLYLNPGAAGKEGFHTVRTAMRFTLNAGRTGNLEVIELGRRS